MSFDPITIGGYIVKAENINITINRNIAGDMTSAHLCFSNKVHIPGVAKGEVPHTYLSQSDVDPTDFYNLAMLLEKIYLGDNHRSQFENMRLD